ncbi:MAG: tetratricopeptide repeat protein [Isosphaeraceae bacterium]
MSRRFPRANAGALGYNTANAWQGALRGAVLGGAMAKRKKKSPGEEPSGPETPAAPREESPPAKPAKPTPRSRARKDGEAKSKSGSRRASEPSTPPEPPPAPSPDRAKPKKAATGGNKKGTKKAAGKANTKGRQSSRARIQKVDWRLIEQAMWRMLGREAPGDSDDPNSPRAAAGELLTQAYAEDMPERAAELAQQALRIWPDCADAHIVLAETARSPHQAIASYERAIDAAERDLGPAAFEVGIGNFWSILPTRPYMRALFGLAQTLWVIGRRDEAITHYRELLRLNPGDNQGVRYRLALGLVETGGDAELESLLRTYEDDASAAWVYTVALHAFRKQGDTARSRALLEEARRTNRFVPDYLLGLESFPSEMAATMSIGDRSEAVDYAAGALNGWRATPGALEWLRRSLRKGQPKPPRDPVAKGPTAAARKRLAKLPQGQAIWFVDARLLPIWVNVPDAPYRPWVLLIADVTGERVVGQEVCVDRPSANLVWDLLARYMSRDEDDPPERPAVIELGEGWDDLVGPLAEIGVEVRPFDDAEVVDDMVSQLVEHVQGRPSPPSLLQMPGIKEPQLASFYEASAAFYRAAPWRYVSGSETVKIVCSRFESGPWYAVVFGQMGMTLGVALYEDLENLVTIRDGHASDEENARATVALSLTYGTKQEIPVEDLDAVETNGWEIAASDAYPSPVRKERGLTMRPPLSWELQLIEATLRALPDFLIHHDRGDSDPEAFTVATGLGPLRLELSWIVTGPAGL